MASSTSISSLLQTVQLEHLPSSHQIHIAVYRNLTNANFLHQQLLAGNSDFEYALIDATVIVSKIHVLAAVYRAVNDLLENRLKTRNVHSEIVFALSPNNNIAESFRRFGISPMTTSVIAVKISSPSQPLTASEIQTHLSANFQGEQVPFTDDYLRTVVDEKRVRKVYKLGAGAGGDKSEEWRELEVGVLGCIALRGAMN